MNKLFELEISVPRVLPLQIEKSCNVYGGNEIELKIENTAAIPIVLETFKPINLDIQVEKEIIEIELKLELPGGGGDHPYYPGPYIVIPKSVDQSLETREKLMARDVLVKEVTTYETSNQKGYTFNIL